MPKKAYKTRKEKWIEDESFHVLVKEPDSIRHEPSNQKILRACHEYANGIRIRVMWGGFGPGTEDCPSSRYWWMLGENATVICRDMAAANFFREKLKEFIRDLDGAVLEIDDDQ